MAEIEITLPTVQYGNVKLRATPEELGLEGPADAYALGVQSAVLLNLFTQGFKVGSQLNVSPPVEASQEAADRLADGRPPRTVDEASEMARALIERELGTTTEVSDPHAPGGSHYYDPTEGYLDDGPGDVQAAASEARDAAPWNSPAVDAKPKPWETGGTAPTNAVKVAEVNW